MLKRLCFAMECSGLLYFGAVVVAIGKLLLLHSFSSLSLVGVLAPPSVASVLFVLVTSLVPGALGQLRLAPPLNITLPMVYLTILALPVYLGPGTELTILQLHQILDRSLVWSSPAMLMVTAGLQVSMLSVLAWRGQVSEGTR